MKNYLHLEQIPYDSLNKRKRHELFKTHRSCLICKGKSKTTRLVVDHCHASGIVRGILCERCNSWLGVLEGKRSDTIKEDHLDKIQSKYGIDRNLFKQYLNQTKYLKRSGFQKIYETPVDENFKPMLTVFLD